MEAGELQPGEQVWSELRGTVRVKSVTSAPDAKYVYNLSVHNQHVYEVSELGVLVHNGCAKWGKQIKGVTQQHHLVSHYKNSARGFSWSTKGQDILKKAGINPKNSGWNKVHLPKHKVPHSEPYHKRVFERLRDAVGKAKPGTVTYKERVLHELRKISKNLLDDHTKLSGVGL